ncbi:DUF2752 domain-containing protein [Streptomyces sp. NPDC012616]|uniref:DUF2752 domain-containing protein n=1 Tax=Streptomyces sp. NPDC012616 TaxID=3364840 RepID=UPI0036EC815E
MTPPRLHGVREAWLGGAVLAALALATALFDPTRPGRFPACPFRAVTGWDCPGCGSLRALHELTHGQVAAAMDYNALLVAFLPFGAVIWLRAVTRRSRPRVLPTWAARALAVGVVLWAVIRNLPLFGGVLAS